MTDGWKDVPGFEGFYQANLDGRVRSVEREDVARSRGGNYYTRVFKSKVLKGTPNHAGYPMVTLWVKFKPSQRFVSHVIMLTFCGARPDGMEVCHNNGKPEDNRFSNLRYDTPKANNADKRKHGTHIEGERIPWSKLTEENVNHIRASRGRITQQKLADMYGVQQSQISRVQNGVGWSHVL